jgi:hypothetical protein
MGRGFLTLLEPPGPRNEPAAAPRKSIEVRIAKTRRSKIAFQAVQFAFPASRRGLQTLLMQEKVDTGGVDFR